MDFTIDRSLVERATKQYGDAQDGDVLVAVEPFGFAGTHVPRGATAIYRAGNITEVSGQRFALDDLSEYPVRVVPSTLDYPAGHESQPVGTEPSMTPDVIERTDVERVIREFASEVGYPGHAQRLIDRLPTSETGHEVKVAFYVQAASQHDANEKVRDSLPNDLDAVILS